MSAEGSGTKLELTRRAAVTGLAFAACVGAAPAAEAPTFPAADGVSLAGHFYGEGRRAIVLVPGGHGVGETWDAQARRLAADGFRVLALDYRGRGRSPGVPPDDEKAHLDVIGAVRKLRTEGAEQVSVVGASWGGWAAGTAAAAEPGLIDRLVLLAHSPFEHPERLSCRTLFILADGDSDGSGRPRLGAIREQYERAPVPKELIVLPGAAHAQFLFLTPQAERLYAEILRFVSAE